MCVCVRGCGYVGARNYDMSLVMRKPAFCICENKDADMLRGDREADQCLCFRYTYSTIPLLPKYEISSLRPSSVVVQPGLCGTWSEISNTGFPTTWLNYDIVAPCSEFFLVLFYHLQSLKKTIFVLETINCMINSTFKCTKSFCPAIHNTCNIVI